MITVAMSTTIDSSRERVWRALTRPGELIRWDERLMELLDPAEDYPSVGRSVRWRYRLGTVPVVLRDDPLEVIPSERLRSALAVGLLRLDETYSLGDEAGDLERTRLTLRLVSNNSVPVVGGLLDRFAVRRLAADFVDNRIRSIQKWCENSS